MTLRIGIIGLGSAGIRHAAVVRSHPGAALIAVADPAPRAQALAAEWQVAWHSGAADLLARADIDAVAIGVPHAMLAATAVAAAERGKHMLLEKPMGISVAEAECVGAACRAAGVRLMVNYVHRFRAEYSEAAALLRAGAIGRPIMLIDIMASGQSALPAWVFDRSVAGGGMLMYNGSHSIDRLLWLADSPVVHAQAATTTMAYPVELEDSAAALLTFANGCLGVLAQHKSAAPRTLATWETLIYGTAGAIRVTTGVGLELTNAAERRQISTGEGDRFRGALDEFVAALGAGRDPTPSYTEGLAAMRVLAALYQSAGS
jgi:predicted dehydrogenase